MVTVQELSAGPHTQFAQHHLHIFSARSTDSLSLDGHCHLLRTEIVVIIIIATITTMIINQCFCKGVLSHVCLLLPKYPYI